MRCFSFEIKSVAFEMTSRFFEEPTTVVSGEFSKKADRGKWFGAKAKNHQQKEYHDPPEAER
jgi:hypothetical protein